MTQTAAGAVAAAVASSAGATAPGAAPHAPLAFYRSDCCNPTYVLCYSANSSVPMALPQRIRTYPCSYRAVPVLLSYGMFTCWQPGVLCNQHGAQADGGGALPAADGAGPPRRVPAGAPLRRGLVGGAAAGAGRGAGTDATGAHVALGHRCARPIRVHGGGRHGQSRQRGPRGWLRIIVAGGLVVGSCGRARRRLGALCLPARCARRDVAAGHVAAAAGRPLPGAARCLRCGALQGPCAPGAGAAWPRLPHECPRARLANTHTYAYARTHTHTYIPTHACTVPEKPQPAMCCPPALPPARC